MNVKCRSLAGDSLLPCSISAGFLRTSKFDVTIGSDYPLYAVVVWKGATLLMIVDDTGLPNVLPAELFDECSGNVPGHWKFTLIEGDVSLICGISRLVDDADFYDKLLSRDSEAISYFASVFTKNVFGN